MHYERHSVECRTLHCTLFLVVGVKEFVFSEWIGDNGNNRAVDGDG